MTAPDQTDLAAALALAAQLQGNADAHQESEGTERRRAAELIEALVAELSALYPRWAAMTTEQSDWQIRALEAERKTDAANAFIELHEHPDDWGVQCVYTEGLRALLAKEES